MRRSGSPVFLDTAYVYALLNARDVCHAAAEERGLSEALTTDDHFVQAGFRALLLEALREAP